MQQDPFQSARRRFLNAVSAEGQFERTDHGGRPVIRIIAPSLFLEFTDDDFIGTDPQGRLFFDSIKDFPKDSRSDYEVAEVTFRGDPHVVVKFTRSGNTYAEFVALDRELAVHTARMGGTKANGVWREAEYCSANATVHKCAGEETVTLDAHPLRINVKFDVEDDEDDVEHENSDPPPQIVPRKINVKGILRFKDEGKLKRGVYARWNPDHIIFYENDRTSSDYTAYFIPGVGDGNPETHLGYEDKVFEGAKWSKYKV